MISGVPRFDIGIGGDSGRPPIMIFGDTGGGGDTGGDTGGGGAGVTIVQSNATTATQVQGVAKAGNTKAKQTSKQKVSRLKAKVGGGGGTETPPKDHKNGTK